MKKISIMLSIIVFIAVVTSDICIAAISRGEFANYQDRGNLLESRSLGENVYSKLIPDFENMSEVEAKKVFDEFSNLWMKEQRLVDELLAIPDNKNAIESLPVTDVNMGSNYTFTFGTEGKNGTSWWGLGSPAAYYYPNERKNKFIVTNYGIGGATAWAWNGRRFRVIGNGSRLAYIDFNNVYAHTYLRGNTGNASYSVQVRIYDATTQTYITPHVTIFQGSNSTPLGEYFTEQISQSLLVSLEAGHAYVPLVYTRGEASLYGTNIFNEARQSLNDEFTQWGQIRIRWQ